MSEVAPNAGALLALVDASQRCGRVPSCYVLAADLGIHGQGYAVWLALQELQAVGLITGVRDTPRSWNHCIRVTRQGLVALGRSGVAVSVPRWRCADCNALTFDTGKPCVICPLLARAA